MLVDVDPTSTDPGVRRLLAGDATAIEALAPIAAAAARRT
jgi:hypothetical protein